MSRIQELLDRKRRQIASQKKVNPEIQIPQESRILHWGRSQFRIIAELKRASLSAGTIKHDLEPAILAQAYERAGASALSVLTEENFFHGSLQDLREVCSVVSLPILQKDFILDSYQIAQAKSAGASFVLLIARFLTKPEISDLLKYSEDIGLNVILEITSLDDLEKLVPQARYIGVNSRNLETLEVDITKFETLLPYLPDCFLIAESGIRDVKTLKKLIGLGYHGALIGEHFLRCEDPAAELMRFVDDSCSGERKLALPDARATFRSSLQQSSRLRVKICGITSEHDALMAIDSGVSALGFIFAESPRRISPEILASFRDRIPGSVLCVGVFRGQSGKEISDTVKRFRLDVAQIYDNFRPEVAMWKACVVRSISDFTSDNSEDNILWDLKAEEPSLTDLWHEAGKRKIFALAGGLGPENVSRAVAICNPEWVDVARGVERSPGIKDEAKLRAFLRELQ